MIRQAEQRDIDGVELSYVTLILNDKKTGPYTVFEIGVYPTRATAQKALDEGALYVLEQEEEICASIIMNQYQPDEYGKIAWPCTAKPEEVLVIHLLCVKPTKARQGLGKQLVQFAQEEAKRRGCKAVRLDTGKQNVPAVSLYQKMGFAIAGSTNMQVGGAIPHEGHLFLEYTVQ